MFKIYFTSKQIKWIWIRVKIPSLFYNIIGLRRYQWFMDKKKILATKKNELHKNFSDYIQNFSEI